MANTNINPYGSGGTLPDGYPITTSLDENVANKAAAASTVYQLKRMIGDGKHWSGKKWYGFGTSITDTSGNSPTGKYAPYLAQLSGMTFVNKGIGGSGITTASNQLLYNSIMSFNAQDADLITLEVGANDGGAPLGTIYDGLSDSPVTDNSTFCGALNKCLTHLLSVTTAQIVVICSSRGRYQYGNPSNTFNGNETSGSDNHTTPERDEAIRKVCMVNSVYCLSDATGMGYARLNSVNGNDYMVDQIHQSNLGGYNFAQAIWSQLKNIPLFYTAVPT